MTQIQVAVRFKETVIEGRSDVDENHCAKISVIGR